MRRIAKLAIAAAMPIAAVLLWLCLHASLTQAQGGPDLTAEIRIDPGMPAVGQEFEVEVDRRNEQFHFVGFDY